MISKMRKFSIVLMLALVGLSFNCYGKSPKKSYVLTAPVNKTTAIRFYYFPESHFHDPLIFCVVTSDDPRLGTAEWHHEGITVYISETVMRSLLKEIQKLPVSLKESKEQTGFGNAVWLQPESIFTITVISSFGTAVMGFDDKRICADLAPLDIVFSTPRTLWEFQNYRAQCGCNVPGFIPNLYSFH